MNSFNGFKVLTLYHMIDEIVKKSFVSPLYSNFLPRFKTIYPPFILLILFESIVQGHACRGETGEYSKQHYNPGKYVVERIPTVMHSNANNA